MAATFIHHTGRTVPRRWVRGTALALLGGLVLFASGDRGAYTAPSGGIDPLEILNLSVRANAIIVLDSSGSMREITSATGIVTGIGNGELVGDDPGAKMAQSKQVLRQIVQDNETKVSFQFGRYTQATTNTNATGVHQQNRFYYGTTDPNAAGLEINPTGNGASPPGVKRRATGTAAQRDNQMINGVTHYYLIAGKFWNGQTIHTNGTVTTAPLSPTNPASVRLTNGTVTVTFQYRGVNWIRGNGGSNTDCTGFESLVPLAPCTANVQIDTIGRHLDPEVDFNPDGSIVGYTDGTLGSFAAPFSQPTLTPSVRPVGGTPIINSLRQIRTNHWTPLWNTTISGMTPKPRTFIIFVTDGDDQCISNDFDLHARTAAYEAELLYRRIVDTEPASSVTTFFIAFGGAAGIARSNWIAWGGSGMSIPNDGTRWNRQPTAQDRANCSTCRDAFVATDAASLSAALQAAIDQGQSFGEFSDQQSITESIFELVSGVRSDPTDPGSPFLDPRDPAQRYRSTVPVLLQSTFEMPDFRGHLKAFRGDDTDGDGISDVSVPLWDAGTKLLARLPASGTLATFTALTGGTSNTADAMRTSTALIKRRIFSTSRNGVFVAGTPGQVVNNLTTARFVPTGQVTLWPPDPNVDPADYQTAGVLDDALGIGPLSVPVLTLAQLTAEFGACAAAPTGGAVPTLCTDTTGNPERRLRYRRKEARQVILAHLAGADLVTDDGLPVRSTTAGTSTTRPLQFRRRPSVMAESTLAAPGVVAPPSLILPGVNNAEWRLYAEGVRTPTNAARDGFQHGFGLANPDDDGNATSVTDANLKPVMTVVYHGTNHALHAFRAGPCPSNTCEGGDVETGGEELWAYVPFDLLGKLRERMRPQARDPHTYAVATPVRFTDVFVPGPFSRSIGGVNVSGSGVWRTILLFGRGAGGTYLTALDVTAPERFNRPSLASAAPITLWNRGNRDTQNGLVGGTNNNSAADATAYSTMGQTWAVPAISKVVAAQNITTRRPGGVEYVAFVGSGYSTNPAHGTRFYTLDVLTGDVVRSHDVGDRSGMPYENALVASPSGFIPDVLKPGGAVGRNPAGALTTRVYQPDIHGRVWRFTPDGAAPTLLGDMGTDHPFGVPAALLNYNGGSGPNYFPHVFVASGNDNRIFPPPANTPPFKLWGLRDEDLTSDPAADDVDGPVTRLFSHAFPNGFRGTAPPATAFEDQDPDTAGDELGRVFFVGTRFNLPGPPPPCASSFDSVLFALGAESGNAAYDLNASGQDEYTIISQQRIQAIQATGTSVVVDMGLGANIPPPPPDAPAVLDAPAPLSNVIMGPPRDPNTGASLLPGLITYRVGSGVCR